jgi:hypothetical protein
MINIAERPAEAEAKAISSSADDVNACPQADPATGISRVETAGDVTPRRSSTLDEVHGFGSPAAMELRWGLWRVASAYRKVSGTGPSIFMLFLAAMASSNSGVAFSAASADCPQFIGRAPEPDQTINLKARAV